MELNKKKKVRWAAIVIAAAIALLPLKHWLFPGVQRPQLLSAPAQFADIEETVLASGTIQPLKLVSVGAQASGRIVALHVALGDHVVKGALIAEIDPSTERNALATAEAVLAQERAQRASAVATRRQADLAFKRSTTTFSQEASSQADLETAEATYNSSNAGVDALEAQIRQAVIAVDTARVTLGFTKVLSPMNGTVVAIVALEGQTVNAVQAAPTIVKLADLETMTVKAQISEADVTRVRPGQRVYFTILGAPEHRYYANLRGVEPAPESIAGEATTASTSTSSTASSAIYYNGLFEIANPNHELRPSMTAEVHVVLHDAKRVLTVPLAALGETRSGERRVVRVVDAMGHIQSRVIRIGINSSATAQVLDGLKAGEEVVVADSDSVASETPSHRSSRMF